MHVRLYIQININQLLYQQLSIC
uniref:Uncharacterized protein n=1 Tax=Anguilla anguilla TaxID=7936 RepID=A0A0E9T9D6_ANGAN